MRVTVSSLFAFANVIELEALRKVMKTRPLLVTGSSGLIGSEMVAFFCCRGWVVHGLDNNMRAEFFGSSGDTRWNLEPQTVLLSLCSSRSRRPES
jgi:hypothetical protein